MMKCVVDNIVHTAYHWIPERSTRSIQARMCPATGGARDYVDTLGNLT